MQTHIVPQISKISRREGYLGLTSEFLGWVVEVACVWLYHTAVIHKPGKKHHHDESVTLDSCYLNGLKHQQTFEKLSISIHGLGVSSMPVLMTTIIFEKLNI